MRRKVILTGGTSLFGSALLRFLPSDTEILILEHNLKNQVKNLNIKTTKLNILNKLDLHKLISNYKPDVLIHAASMSNVDYCEKHKKEAWRINVGGTKNILESLAGSKTHFIYLSSNAVFNGHKQTYEEKDTPDPINYYGKTKHKGELLTERYQGRWTIIRPITMYGWEPKGARINPVTWVINTLKSKQPIKVVKDVYLNPLYNMDLGAITWKIILNNATGIYHIAGTEILNRYQWALKTAEVFDLDKNLITPVPSSYFTGKIANRPTRTVYSIKKIRKEFNFTPRSVSEGLIEMKRQKENPVTLKK